MRPAGSAVWDWLRTLANAEEMPQARQRAWGELLRDGALNDACRAAVAAGELGPLAKARDGVARPEVAQFLQEQYRPAPGSKASPLEAGRLLGGVLGTLAAAQAVRATQDFDLPALVRAVGAVGTATIYLNYLQKARESVRERRRWAAARLAELGPAARPALPALRLAADDGDPVVRRAAVDALKKVEGQETRR